MYACVCVSLCVSVYVTEEVVCHNLARRDESTVQLASWQLAELEGMNASTRGRRKAGWKRWVWATARGFAVADAEEGAGGRGKGLARPRHHRQGGSPAGESAGRSAGRSAGASAGDSAGRPVQRVRPPCTGKSQGIRGLRCGASLQWGRAGLEREEMERRLRGDDGEMTRGWAEDWRGGAGEVGKESCQPSVGRVGGKRSGARGQPAR